MKNGNSIYGISGAAETFRVRHALTKPFVAAIGLMAGLVIASASVAGQYPERPVHLIVPFPPGGPTDVVGRVVAQHLSISLGQPVIVENRPGAAGALGVEAVAKAAPDGYTIGLGSTGTLAVAPSMNAALPYDPVKSFAPISLLVKAPFLVAVNPSVPAATLAELVAFAKAHPGELNFGSNGTGGSLHIAGEMFKQAAGVDLNHVPYKGAAPALTDLLAGRIQVMFEQPATFMPYLSAGRVRALAVASSSRLAQLQDVPTAAEAGLPGYDVSVWFGLLAPTGTPPETIDRLNQQVRRDLANQEVRDVLVKQGLEPTTDSAPEFSSFIATEYARWTRAVKASRIKAD
jgi:tripartite-type tricarboxylate transporter receptor subunit TctC